MPLYKAVCRAPHSIAILNSSVILVSPSYLVLRAMKGTPDAPDALVQTLNGLVDGAAVPLAGGVAQQIGLLEDLLLLKLADTDSLGTAVDVVALDDWLLAGARRHGDLDGRVPLGESGECVLKERLHAL